MLWRYIVFGYLLIGGAFVLYHARRWWAELERAVHRLHETRRTLSIAWVRVAAVAAVGLVFVGGLVLDVVLWPRPAWLFWRERRKQRRWQEHGDFCHRDECDRD
jgi:hypothetical protein